jgi:NAD(P)-dependent dehydrogenase (short-subunit alcohol dehydrogenase family)
MIRRAVSTRKPVVLHVVRSRDVLEFVNSAAATKVSQEGPATPDHMLRTKRAPLFIKARDILKFPGHAFVREIISFRNAHERYFLKYKKRGMRMLDPNPRIILVPGVGLIATGKDKDAALQCAEVYEHSIQAMRGAEAVDRYKSLSLSLAFEMEYWSLELYKLSLAPSEKALARKIALVTGATGAIGRAICERLCREGAHVVVCDLNFKTSAALASELTRQFGRGRAIGMKMDVRNESEVQNAFANTVLEFGGIDLIVSNAGIAHISSVEALSLEAWEENLGVNATGHFLVAREAMKLFRRQALGGNMIFITTKNVLAPGKDFGAYSASKSAEAQLARICAIEGGEHGVRSNMVNPDGVFEGSGLWSKQVRQSRARSYGISTGKLEAFYQSRNLLKTKVRPEEVGSAVLFLASEESSKTTGCIVTVDGGVREAFPR